MGETNSSINNTLRLTLKNLNISTNSIITSNDRVIDAFGSYERLLASKEQVDGMLSLFSFRGVLEGFVPIIDEEVVNNILEEINLINIQNNL